MREEFLSCGCVYADGYAYNICMCSAHSRRGRTARFRWFA